jgi:hypothetical protein
MLNDHFEQIKYATDILHVQISYNTPGLARPASRELHCNGGFKSAKAMAQATTNPVKNPVNAMAVIRDSGSTDIIVL